MDQFVIYTDNGLSSLEEWIKNTGCKSFLLVCDSSIRYQNILCQFFINIAKVIHINIFSDFQPNPLYKNIQEGVKKYRNNCCDGIIAVGGGSALDVAKCIKLFANLPGEGENGTWLKMDYLFNPDPFLVIPTTAGTGSEATRFAVIYYEGKKQSITHDSVIPNAVFFYPDALISLPLYQKKATMCDALCHAIESFWSINSTQMSKAYSRNAIQLIFKNMDGYLNNTKEGRNGMLNAAYMAGKAINITQTTAGHAMCYKITSLFGCSHGHAAILCNRILFRHMIEHIDDCIDPRGKKYLLETLDEIGISMGCQDAIESLNMIENIFFKLELTIPKASEAQFMELTDSVNLDRLKNHPIHLDKRMIYELYHEILG